MSAWSYHSDAAQSFRVQNEERDRRIVLWACHACRPNTLITLIMACGGGGGNCDYVITFHYRTSGFLIGVELRQRVVVVAVVADVGLAWPAVINFFVVCSQTIKIAPVSLAPLARSDCDCSDGSRSPRAMVCGTGSNARLGAAEWRVLLLAQLPHSLPLPDSET